MPTDLEIARAAPLRPIAEVAGRAGIPADALHPYGRHIAKLDGEYLKTLDGRPQGKLVLVTAISPTPAGEGKTTTTIGLGDALNRIGRRTMICLREPSLGPCFGQKGGATGGGRAQVVPMEQINLHFTGDFHAIGAANNLAAAMLDNHVYWGNALGIDTRRVGIRRALDVNDRALRGITVGLGGAQNGFPREDGFDITVASEVMAVFCLARDLADMEARLGRMILAQTRDRRAVTVADLRATGAMSVLLKDAILPNLVQTIDGSPALVHGGPFANIAHGCNSVVATNLALGLADYVVTEAGFGADLGAEKFLDIKCRQAGLNPEAVVIVATVRALKMHGGLPKDKLGEENLDALKKGMANLERHIENVSKFGIKPIVAINAFVSDTDAEFELIKKSCQEFGTDAVLCTHWANGGKGATELAEKVVAIIESGESKYKPLYEAEKPIAEKMRTVAKEIYRAKDIAIESKAKTAIKTIEDQGYGNLPICVAKTQYSFSADAKALNAPSDHIVPIVDARLSAGAGFVVLLCGDVMTLPGLSASPAAHKIGLDEKGEIVGLF